MSQCIDLDELVLTAPEIGLQLCVSAHLFMSGEIDPQLDIIDLSNLLRNQDMWILPPNVFYLQLKVQCDSWVLSRASCRGSFLDNAATTICLSSASL